MTKENRRIILTAVKTGLIINILLASIKISSGIIGSSQALFSDGLNSFSDVFISMMLLLVLRLASKKPDHDHPYGHEKFEGLGYFVLGIVFLLTAIYIFIQATISIITLLSGTQTVDSPQLVTLYVAFFAFGIKLFLYAYFKRVSKKIDSPTIKADAKNHMIDAWATLVSIIGIILTQFNLIIFDYIASIIIGFFILRLGIQIILEAITYLVDQAPSDEEINQIKDLIQSIKGVMSIDELKIRKHVTQLYVDVEIGVISTLSLEEAHLIAENVHHRVEKKFPEVIHCMVHVNPYKKTI